MSNRPFRRQAAELGVVPAQVVETIIRFADENDAPLLRGDVIPESPRPIPRDLQVNLCALSPMFQPGLRELSCEYTRRNAVINIQSTDRQAIEKVHTTTTVCTETLVIQAGNVHDRVFHLASKLDLASFDSLIIDWNSVFAACPNLQRLDLRAMPLHSAQLVKILEAASRHCMKLVALLLPVKDNLGPDCPVERHNTQCQCVKALRPLMDILLVSIERWFRDGNSGGLRQLHVPQRNVHNLSLEDFESEYSMKAQTDKFLEAVAAFCPNVEYFDGYRSTFRVVERGFKYFSESDEEDDNAEFSGDEEEENGEILCDEFMYCSPKVWDGFCQSCTKLREFNWFVVPFSPEYFESFAKYPKPHLKKLTVGHGSHFNFRVYDSAFSEEFHSGHGGIMSSVVSNCPALEHFQVFFLNDYEGYDSGDVLIGAEKSENWLRWSDDDLEAIVVSCPQLKFVELVLVRNGEEPHLWGQIKARGPQALAGLHGLRSVRMTPSLCSARDLMPFLEKAPLNGTPRQVSIELIDGYGFQSENKYEGMVSLLKCIVENVDKLQGRRFDLTLKNICYSYCGPVTTREFLTAYQSLTKQLRESSSDVGVEVLIDCKPVDVDTFNGNLSKLSSVRFYSPRTLKDDRRRYYCPDTA